MTRQRRVWATGASIGLHGVFLLALFSAASGVAPKGVDDPFGEGEAIEVSLVGLEGARGQAVGSEAPSALEALRRRLSATTSPAEPASERQPAADLSRLLGEEPAGAGQGRAGFGDQALGDRRDGRDAASARAAFTGVEGDASASGALWGAIQPCWRRIAGRSKLSVTLDVQLAGDGRLASPPRIVRPGAGSPQEAQLVAEAQALAAIKACLPYRSVAIPGLKRQVRVVIGGR